MFYLKICNDFSKPYQYIFEDSKKMFFNIRLWVKAIRKSVYIFNKRSKEKPSHPPLRPRFMVKEKR